MLRSMTGFSRLEADTSLGRINIELQSLNRKHLEISIYLPKELFSVETVIRKWVSAKVFRGMVNIRLNFALLKNNLDNFLPDVHLLQTMKDTWQKIANKLGYDPNCVDLAFLLQQNKALPIEKSIDLDKFTHSLKQVVEEGLNKLLSMKEQEGSFLLEDLKKRTAIIEKIAKEIKTSVPKVLQTYRTKLEKKIQDIAQDVDANEERILREVMFFSEKIDITEELTRLFSHLEQCSKLFQSKELISGKKIEFLVQEIHREVNTLSAKSTDIDIIQKILLIKAELDKIKEQIQNIE